MTNLINQEPRNISMSLHRRVGRFVKLELYFASKWILISEVIIMIMFMINIMTNINSMVRIMITLMIIMIIIIMAALSS